MSSAQDLSYFSWWSDFLSRPSWLQHHCK